MPAIFGLMGAAAASVDWYLLDSWKLFLRLLWFAELVEESRRHCEERLRFCVRDASWQQR